MASVRSSRGRLFLDYRAGGRRLRHYCKLEDSAANRAYLVQVARQVDAAVASGHDVEVLLANLGLSPASNESALDNMALTVPDNSHPSFTPLPSVGRLSATPLFRTFSEQWFNEFKVGWRKTYIATVRGILDKYLVPEFGHLNIGAINRAQILDFRSRLAQVKGRRLGSTLSPARINTVMLIFKQVLQEGADRHEFTVPMARIRPLKVPKSDVHPFSLDQVRLLIDAIRPDYKNYLTTRFFTGMRSGEIHGLKWKYVDFERRLILVREAIVGGEEEYTKTDSSQRDIQMSQLVYEALRRQQSTTGHLIYVFCNRAGAPVDTANFTKRVWYPLLRLLDLDLRRPYQTRHTAASLWLAAGESPEWIARTLGHASTEVLFAVYSRFIPNLTKRDGAAFDRLLADRFGSPDGN